MERFWSIFRILMKYLVTIGTIATQPEVIETLNFLTVRYISEHYTFYVKNKFSPLKVISDSC